MILGATGHGCSAEGTDAAPRAHRTGALQASQTYVRTTARSRPSVSPKAEAKGAVWGGGSPPQHSQLGPSWIVCTDFKPAKLYKQKLDSLRSTRFARLASLGSLRSTRFARMRYFNVANGSGAEVTVPARRLQASAQRLQAVAVRIAEGGSKGGGLGGAGAPPSFRLRLTRFARLASLDSLRSNALF